MWRVGLRVGETVALEWRDMDLTAGTLLVRRGKGGRGRTVPLHLPLWPRIFGAEYFVAKERGALVRSAPRGFLGVPTRCGKDGGG